MINRLIFDLSKTAKATKTKPMNNTKTILAFGVYYVPNYEAKIFAGLKSELCEAFKNQSDAINYCQSLQQCGSYDELHIGYRVYPMNWIPKNVIVK